MLPDPAARTEDLLAHAGWLRALAAKLVHGSDNAEDLVQDTWLVALTRPPRVGQHLRPWLARVMRNLASNRRRGERRRAAREAAAEPAIESLPATDEVVAELEAQQALVEALLQLEEPLRSTLVIRYYRGLDSSQIARRQGVPAGTVRWRLKRGIDELRSRLDARFGGSRSSWCLLLGPLAVPKLTMAGAAAAAAGGALAPGVLVMGSFAKVASAAVILAIVGGLCWFGGVQVRRDASTQSRVPAPATAEAIGVEPRSDPVPLVPLTQPQQPTSPVGRTSVPQGQIPGANDLVVRVVDPSGKSLAEVPVRLVPPQSPRLETAAPSGEDALHPQGGPGPAMAQVTDAQGLAVFPDARTRLELAGEPWILRHDVIFEDPPSLMLDPATLARDVVVSVQPYSGSFEVVVREIDRQEPAQNCWGELALAPKPGALNAQRGGHGPRWCVETVDGRAMFRWVELGRTWDLAAWPSGAAVYRARGQAPGPRRPEERASAVIVLGADVPVVVFRALDGEGVPLVDALLEIVCQSRFGRNLDERLRCRTDDRGRFRVYGESAFMCSHALVTYDPLETAMLQGRANMPTSLKAGLNAGGDVVLVPEPSLVEGIVSDESGNGVEGAQVIAFIGERSYVQVPAGPTGRRLMTRSQGHETRATSDANGRFQLGGSLPAASFELRAEARGMRSIPIQVATGARDVQLVVSPSHGLYGRVLADPWIELDKLEVCAERLGPGCAPVAHAHPSQDGSFFLGWLKLGTYRVTFSMEGSLLATREEISLTADTDLGPIDLRRGVERCEIALLYAVDSGSIYGEVSWRPSGSTSDWTKRGFKGTSIELLVPSLPIDVWIRPAGYRHGVLHEVFARAEFPLANPLRVRLELRTQAKLPEAPYSLMPDLWQDGVRVGQPEGRPAFSEGDRSVVWLVSTPGGVRVRWKLEQRHGGASRSGNVLDDQAVEIEVKDVDGEQLFEIELEAEALERLMAAPPW